MSTTTAIPMILLASLAASPAPAQDVSFDRDVRPILSENCYYCHGPDPKNRKAGLRLDDRQAAIEKQVIVPGNPDESELVARVFAEDALEVMPPPQSHKTLTST